MWVWQASVHSLTMQPDRGAHRFKMATPFVHRVFTRIFVLLSLRASLIAADTCTFEDGMCPEWVSTNCSTRACFEVRKVADMKYGPTTDHTFQTDTGSSAYATLKNSNTGRRAQLSRRATGPLCFTAWYHLSGTEIGLASFTAHNFDGFIPRHFYVTRQEFAGRWQRVRYSDRRSGTIEISIRYNTKSTPEKGLFAVDDITLDTGECPREPTNGSCDFDWGDTCGYDLGSGTRKWQLQDSAKNLSPDYSTSTAQGGFVRFEATADRFPMAVLASPVLPVRKGIQCLRFHYVVSKTAETFDGVYSMSVSVKASKSFVVWARTSKELLRDTWTPVDIAFNVDGKFKIEFSCDLRTSQNYSPYCAIDAIWLDDCNGNRAPKDNLCNFEDGWCSWRNKNAPGNRPTWQLGGTTMKTTLLKPQNDHTYENDSSRGSYVFFSNYQRMTGDQAELLGELLPMNTKITQCAEFWYIISGDKSTKLEVLSIGAVQASSKESHHWRLKGGGSTEWQLGRVAVPNYKRVVFRGTAGPAWAPVYVALDDIAITQDDRCQTFPQDADALSAEELISCTFQRSDLCHWISLGVPSSAWMSGQFVFVALGPWWPPKNERGGIVYMTGAWLAPARGNVQLHSPMVDQHTEPSCFSIWYHMFGGRGATLFLNVSKQDAVMAERWRPSLQFLQRDRTTTDRWYNVRRTVLLDGVKNMFTFFVSNMPSMRRNAIVALGPVKLTPGACGILTDGEGYCDFEFDTCTWMAAKGWQREQKNKASQQVEGLSGPVNSVYVMTATQISSSLSGAELTSPEWQGQKEPRCLEFWYRSEGRTAPQLQVEISVNGKSEVVWKKPSYPGPEWMLARTQIVQEKTFQVLLRANFSNDASQSASLDDIVLRPESCAHPAECNFIDDLCGYVNKFQGDFRWLVGRGRLESPRLQPNWPTSEGHAPSFTYLDLTTGKVNKDVSEESQRIKTVGLLSPLFHVSDDITTLSIQYFRTGPDITSANLSVSCYGDGEAGDVQLARELGEVTVWTWVNATLKRGTNCQLAVRVARGDGAKGAMAISAVQVTASKKDVKPPSSSDSSTRCTFEEGNMCGWRTTSMPVNWRLNDPTKKIPDVPRFDHTLKAYRGRFLFASNEKNDLAVATLQSPDLDVNATDGACLSLWLFTVHASQNNFAVLVGRDKVFETNARASHRWEHVLIDFKRRVPGSFKIVIQAYFGSGLVALDDIQLDSRRCPPSDFCSWEVGSRCLLTPAPGSFATWQTRRAAVVGLPDHTRKNLKGRYLYLNTTAVDSHHPVSRVFMETRSPTDATCVTFWYSGHGARSVFNAYMFTKETALRDPIVSGSTPYEDGLWLPRSVTVSSRTNWNLVFEGVAAAGVKRDSGIMVDDLEFSDGKCPPYNLCTFEDECLPWRIPTNGEEAAFEVERAGSFSKLPRDHTTQTPDGYYLLFKSPGIQGNRTSMILRERQRYECLSLWYYLPALSDGVELHLQEVRMSQGKGVWKRYQMEYPSLTDDPIVAVSGKNADGFVAIDDVLLNEVACDESSRTTERFDCGNKQVVTMEHVCDFVVDCSNGADESACGNCDFSKDACGWKLDGLLNLGSIAWRRMAIGGVLGSPPTGSDDRRKGYYLLLHSNVTAPGRRGLATIDSPTIRNTNKLCTLHFWYNFARNESILDIDLYMRVAGYVFPVWTLSALRPAPRESVWNEARAEIGRYPRDISFYFASRQTSVGWPTFAVDLIDYKDCALPAKTGNCTDSSYRCANGACVSLYARCDYVDDCGDNSDEEGCGDYRLGCNFDTSFCDWVPQAPPERDMQTWKLGRPSSSLVIGPTRDRTTGTSKGRFLLLSSGRSQTSATITGPKLANNETCVISFFYMVQGERASQLKLGVRTTKDGPWKVVWKQTKPTEFFHFIESRVSLTESAPFQVAFIGEHNEAAWSGYIAIDDVTFMESCKPCHGELPTAPVPTSAPPSCGEREFECAGSGQCIPLSQVCDFKEDCSNGADESRCGECEFSTDLCGLENEGQNTRLAWQWTKVQDGKKNNLFPTTDSRFSEDGAYAAYSLVNPDVPWGLVQPLVTPKLGEIAHSCVVSFYAFVPSKGFASLRFGVMPPTGKKTQGGRMNILATIIGSRIRGRWAKITVKVGNWKAGARFFYQANTVGVSIDRPQYRHCHPDVQSEGWEATRQVSCDFSSPVDCGWFPERMTGNTHWIYYAGGTGKPTLRWQPTDSESHKGPYLYARNKDATFGSAYLVSIKMAATPSSGRCFTFWYNIWHPNVGQLNLLKRVDNTSRSVLWSRVGPQGKDWKQGQIQLHSEDSHQLVFEAILIPGSPGVIGIDNFNLTDTQCDNGKVCTFETDSCGWQLHNWERTSGSSVVVPQSDYSTRSSSGSFALARSPSGRMVSPQGWYDGSRDKCLRFWFFITGSTPEALNLTRVSAEGREESVWFATKTDAPFTRWYSTSVSLPTSKEMHTAAFEGKTSGDAGTAVAVDDISLSDEACPAPGSCTFEEDMCNWYNSRSLANAQWYRHRGNTVSNSTGIGKDHTLGTEYGFYLLLDAEDLARQQIGSLRSQVLSFGPNVCFRLYYFTQKGSGAALEVSFIDEKGLTSGQPVVLDIKASSEWTLFTLESNDAPSRFSIVITGSTGSGVSDVAIDDIDLRAGKCELVPLPTSSRQPTIPTSAVSTTPVATEYISTQKPLATLTTEPWPTVPPEATTREIPTAPPPRPSVQCYEGYFYCRDGSTCVPAVLLCDGVRDCPNGLDENCGSTSACKVDEFFCASRSPSACLPRSVLCDGHEDCSGGSDEALCRVCPRFYCRNNATCMWTPQTPYPSCDCGYGYKGRRCEVTELKNPEPIEAGRSSKASIVTGIVIIFVAIVLVAAFTVFWVKRRRASQISPLFLNNPSYNASTNETKLFN